MPTKSPTAKRPAPPSHVDVLIIGAGLSGIGAACHLRSRLPGKNYAILEARDTLGGTWDLFRYPGIRSDSDMHTLGYRFRPWLDGSAIADGDSILRYLRDTAAEAGVDRHIRYGHRATRAAWTSEDCRWTVEVEVAGGEAATMTCDFLFVCTGYYRYDEGYTPEFAGTERFRGEIVHPQHWPEDLDYTGKRVVVIGSGATAVTLVPAMAERAAHVTMLQRSPSYVLAIPGEDPLEARLRSFLPRRLAARATRWKNMVLATLIYQLSRRRPALVKRLLRAGLERQLPAGFDIDRHFTPSYNPWDQRLCLARDGDLFKALRDGGASIVTDSIDTFTEDGLRLASGQELEADIVITATGLNLLAFGGLDLEVDGEAIDIADTLAYKATMLSGLPNFAFTIGYTNASWTLKADLASEFVCRVLAHMDRHGYRRCMPTPVTDVERRPLLDFQSGYVLRSIDAFPKQGSKAPWQLGMSYFNDIVTLRHGSVADGALRFDTPARTRGAEPALAA
jgi:cation diffusion facilitator CzcD-associated flavoprotein CzcO